jgi:large subunit ribosomal protein L22
MAKNITPTPVAPIAVAKKTVFYQDKNIKMSPRKLRLVANLIKQITPKEALVKLKFINNKSAPILAKAIKTVVSDAQNNFHLNLDNLVFYEIRVDEGIKFKRMDKSHGSRFNRGLIQKRHSRLIITLKELENKIESKPVIEKVTKNVDNSESKTQVTKKTLKVINKKSEKTTKKTK